MARLASAGALAAGGLAGCAAPAGQGTPPREPVYLGSAAERLDADLVALRVEMRDAPDMASLTRYADCAAARYAADRDHGYARHVRTNLAQTGGISRADAVYTISPTPPRGVRTIVAAEALESCRAQGIPTD